MIYHRVPTQSICITDVIMVNAPYLPFASSVAVYTAGSMLNKQSVTFCYGKLLSFCLRSGILNDFKGFWVNVIYCFSNRNSMNSKLTILHVYHKITSVTRTDCVGALCIYMHWLAVTTFYHFNCVLQGWLFTLYLFKSIKTFLK